jgi:hypothetical protein
VSAASDGRVTLWDGRSGALLGTVTVDADSAAIFLDDQVVQIASLDGAVYEWDTSAEHAVEFACRIVGRSLSTAEGDAVLPNRPYQETCP